MHSGSGSSTGHVRIPHDANCIAASLQGFKPSVGWDTDVEFPLVSVSWLSWVSPSLGLSLSLFLAFSSLLSGTSRKFPVRVPVPVLQSFKDQGNQLVSSETAGPFEVSVLVPSIAPCGVHNGCRTGHPTSVSLVEGLNPTLHSTS